MDHNELEAKIAKMDSSFKMKQTNMAMQEADTLLFLLKMVAQEADEKNISAASKFSTLNRWL